MATDTASQGAIASYENLVRSWGIEITPDVEGFIKHAVSSGWSSAQFLQAFRLTKAYHYRFPGILRNDGTLRMTEAQYLSGYNSAKDYAATVGRELSIHAYGMALANGNSPSEIKDKLAAVDSLKTNSALLQSFTDYLAAKGYRDITPENVLRFVMKQGPVEWEQEWQIAQAAATFEKLSSIAVGKPKQGGDISYKTLEKLQSKLLPGETPDFGVLSIIPMDYWAEHSVSKRDLAKAVFGNRQALIKVHRAAAEFKLAQEPTANPQLGQPTRDRMTQASE